MASLLDYYSSITDQLHKIKIDHISSYRHIKQQEKYFQIKFQSMLNVITQKIDPNKTYQIQHPTAHISTVTFLYDIIYPDLDILTKVEFNKASYQISLNSTILRNYIPLRVKQKQMKLSINRYLIRINGILKYGYIRLNPCNGELIFCMNSILTIYQFESFIYQPLKLVQFLNQELLKSRHYIRMHIYKILYLMNQIDQNYSENPVLSSYQINSINFFSKATIKLLDKILPFLNLQFPFMYNDHTYSNIKNVSPDLIRKMNQMIRLLKYNSKLIQDTTMKAIQQLTNNNVEIKTNSNFTFTDDQKKDLMNILLPPFVKHSTGEPPYVYSEIQIKNDPKDIKWDIVDQGGFGMISKAQIQFVYKRDVEKYHPRMNYPFSRMIVKKDDYSHTPKSKLLHQKDILSNMKHSISPFIAKFYYSEQQSFNQSLLLQYCPQKSFASFRQKNKQFMTLNSKLIFLKYIAQAIKFLKDHKICHLDLKPSNILFGNNQIKLIDFGEAYHPQICQKNFRPGTSLPYAPPESFSQQINFTDRLDIFSLGILMFQMLYDTYPMQHSKYQYNKLKQAYVQKTYLELIQFAPEKCQYIGNLFIFIYGDIQVIKKFISI